MEDENETCRPVLQVESVSCLLQLLELMAMGKWEGLETVEEIC